MNFRVITSILILFLVLFISCEADVDVKNISDEIALQPSLVVPVAGASINWGQFLAAHYHGENLDMSDNSEINYISKDSAMFLFGALNFMDNAVPLSKNIYPSPVNITTIPPNTAIPTFSSTDLVNLGINSPQSNDRIDSVKVTSISMSVTINVTPDMKSIDPSNLKLTIILPTDRVRMLGGGSNIITVVPVAYGQPVNVPLTNFMLNTSNGATGFPLLLRVDAKSGNVPLTLSQNSVVTCDISFSQLAYSVAYGDFESATNLSFTHRRLQEFGKVFPTGLLKFTNPQLHIKAISNIGTYLSFNVDYIKAFVSTDASIPPVYAWFNGHTTNSLADQFDSKPASPGLSVSKDFKTFDKDWGETNLMFENVNRPDMIEYKFSAGINKTLVQNDPTPSFITSDAKVKVYFTYTIPFQLNKGSYYEYRDTIRNIFSDFATVLDKYVADKISSVAIVLNIKNGYPVQTQLALQFMDSLGQKLLTDIEKNYTVQAGNVDANGIVQLGNEAKQTITLLVTKAQIPELRKAKSIDFSVRFDGESIQSNIHFTKLNTFDLKVGLFVKGDLNEKLGTIIK